MLYRIFEEDFMKLAEKYSIIYAGKINYRIRGTEEEQEKKSFLIK
jgi:hypothetical protein